MCLLGQWGRLHGAGDDHHLMAGVASVVLVGSVADAAGDGEALAFAVVLGLPYQLGQEDHGGVPLRGFVLPLPCRFVLVGIGGAEGEVDKLPAVAVGLHLRVVPEVAGEGDGAVLGHGGYPFWLG